MRLDRLGPWLRPRLGATGPVRITEEGRPAAIGYSSETIIFGASYRTAAGPVSRRFVLRAETPDAPVYPAQAPGLDLEIDIQRRIMEAVAAFSTVPVAPVIGAEPAPAVIGAPFFVMAFVDGDVPTVSPPYTKTGFFLDARPEQRAAMIGDGLRVLAAIHRIDWASAGLGWLLGPGATPTVARQLQLWTAQAQADLGRRRHRDMEAAAAVLGRHLPAGSGPVLCWGDPRPGNMIWQDWRCACVTDWEAAAIAPPELDVSWWLMFDRCSHEVVDAPRLDGEPTREEQAAAYEAAAGWDLGDLRLYELFAAYRYCATVIRVTDREVQRGRLPADHTVWLENPASTCVQQLLAS